MEVNNKLGQIRHNYLFDEGIVFGHADECEW